MKGEVVDMDGKRREAGQRNVPDFWFAQLDQRLGQMEFLMARVEKQIWLVVCAVFVLGALELVSLLIK